MGRGKGRDRVGPGGCAHNTAALVTQTDAGHVSRCLVCGTLGPPRETSEEARQALQDLARPERDEG
ncbi:MAG: hypothetical protein M3Q49_02665 [Actinomycetota bacterium]|nr:hypothetical protein [Actinomycetota bacterium]